ncbi:TOG array regulator of axonemal microtubules protein 1 [Trichonephila clavipes]|uniref:TOG array regulator of axonemal microtubules protein 1 n=1 Tax=Trichonephila clavipes TaxID=2585209 RepID=A0A8X6VZ49_TRICX|nr:TOG array regulator of axonemal microtubules protein 1 [Trichonephila clavipes]
MQSISSVLFQSRYSRRSENFRDHQNCKETSSCRGESEMILMQLRRLWKTLLNKNEKSPFEERKLCRTRLVKFLEAYIFNPCERVRFLALDLLCGSVPRLDDKTDSLLRPLMPKAIHCLDENSAKDVKMKALHFLRIYSRYTKNLRGINNSSLLIHWCAKFKDEVEKLAYQLNEEAEWTERPIRRLSKVMYGSTCADMQVDVMGECLSSIKHVVGVRSVFLAKRLHAV